MLSAKLGHIFDKPLRRLAQKIPLSPNALTVIGFLITGGAAFAISHNLVLGGILMLIGAFFDMLDGIVARATGKVTKFGAFLDSVLDRCSDAFLFLAIAWYLAGNNNHVGAFLSIGTLVGAFLVSYARARSEGLGETCHVGLLERPERIILLIFAAITGWLVPVLWIMLILTHITVVQRIHHVWRVTRRQ